MPLSSVYANGTTAKTESGGELSDSSLMLFIMIFLKKYLFMIAKM